jgi:hypothetical protein
MNTLPFYLGALALCALAYVVIKDSSTYPLTDGPISENKSRRRFFGRILLATSGSFAVIGVLAQMHAGSH